MIQRLQLLVTVIGMLCAASCASSGGPLPGYISTPAPWASLEPSQRNQAAQAYYNQQLADQIRGKQERAPLLQFIEDDAVGWGAFLGGLLAIVSLVMNVGAARRQERDTKIYEAVKRLGDKDSPATRASAAGLVYVLGRPNGILRFLILKFLLSLSRRLGVRRLWLLSYDYYLAVSQLVTALAIEPDANVIKSLSWAIDNLIPYDAPYVRRRLSETTVDADLIENIGTCLAALSAEELETTRSTIAALLSMSADLLDSYVDKERSRIVSSGRQFELADKVSQTQLKQAAFASIRSVAARRKAHSYLMSQTQHFLR